MSIRTRALFLTGLLAAVSCSDAGNPLSPEQPGPVPGLPSGAVQPLDCTVTIATGELRCELPQPDAGEASAAGQLIIGGQNVYVRLASSGFAVNADTIQFDVTVENLIRQPIGTADGTTVHADGVRVFFAQDPVSNDPSGPAAVANADGEAMFTAPDQPFFQWNEMLAENEVSAPRTWQLQYSPGSTSVSFRVYVAAQVQYPTGWIEVVPPADTLLPAASTTLSATAYDRVGRTDRVDQVNFRWSTVSASGVVTVDSLTGEVTAGAASGVDTVRVTNDTGQEGFAVVVVNTPLVANDVTYPALGNVSLDVPTHFGLGQFASDADGDDVSIVPATDAATDQGGLITVSADGSFLYRPAAGFSGADTYTFTATDGTAFASATLTIDVGDRYWFAQADQAGTGTMASPGTLKTAETGSAAGETIFVLHAGASTSGVNEGIVLKDGQALIGQGVSGSVVRMLPMPTGAVDSLAVTLLAAGSAPGITRTTAGPTVQLAVGNTVRGLGISSTAGAGIAGTGFGTLTTGDALSISATGGPVLLLSNGALAGTFAQVSSSASTGAGISLTNVTGTLAPTGGAITNPAGAGVLVSGGSVNFTWTGNVSQPNGAALVDVNGGHDGTLAFNTGTLSASGGTGLQFNGVSGTYTFDGITTLNGGDAGVDITNGSDGTFTFGTGTSITNPTGTAFNVYGSSPAVTFGGGITKGNAGAMVEVGEQPGGSVTFQTGTLEASAGSGISLSNADGTVAFNGTTTLSGGPSVAVVAGSAGTISFASGASVATPSSAGILVSASAPTFTYAGTVSGGAARPAQIEGMTGGSVAVSGAVTGTSQGILVQNNNVGTPKTITFSGPVTLSTGTLDAVTLTNNAGATIGFTGGNTDLTTTTGATFTASGGGTVNVTGGGNDLSTGTGSALNLNGVSLGALGMSFATLNVSGAATAPVVLTGVGVTSASVLTVSGGSIVAGNGTRLAVSGGSVNLNWAGSISQSTASQPLLAISGGHTGTTAFTGAVSATNGTGLQFDNADGSYTFSGTTTLNGGDAGIDVTNGSGGTFSFNGSTAVTNATNELIRIANSAPTVTYSGSVQRTVGNASGIVVQNNTGGSVLFDGDATTADGDPADVVRSLSTGTAAAVSLSSNGGMSISFTGGGLALATTSGAGLNVTGGGTVIVQGAGNTVNSNGGGTAVNVQNTTIGGSGITFYSVNATGGGTNGIVLSNTGGGGFQVTGDGASDAANTTRGRTTARSGGGSITLGSGGTISGKSSDAIQLATTGAVTLRNLVVQNNAGDGIQASAVGGLTIDNALISGHTDNSGVFATGVSAPVIVHSQIENNAFGAGAPGADIHNVRLISNTGTGSVTHSVIANTSAGAERQLQIFSTSGTLNISVQNSRIAGSTAGDGVGVYAFGSSNITANFQNDSIHNNSAFGIDSGTETTQSATLNITVNNTRFHNNFVGVTVAHGSSGTNTFNVTNNNFQNHGSISVNVNRLGGGAFTGFGLFSGTVSGNTIGTAGIANSGSASGSPIRVVTNGNGGTSRVSVVNNTIREYAEHGITVIPRDANSGHTLHARIHGNSIANPHGFALDGVNVTMGALNTDVISLCLDIGGSGVGNSVANSPRNGVRVRSSGLPAANVSLTAPGYDGSGATYFANRNPAATGVSGNASFSNASGTTTAGNCTTP